MKTLILTLTLFVVGWHATMHVHVARAEEPKAVYPVALLPFKERGREARELGTQVSDLLFANLVMKPELFLVDREDIKSTFRELELNLSGVVAPGEANKVGHLTGARILVTGSVLNVNGSIYLIAKIMGTETSRVKGTSVKGKRNDDIDTLVEKLAEEVAKTIAKNADSLVAKTVSREDRIKALKKALGDAKRPSLLVNVEERHVGNVTFDPAAETEVMLFATETGFRVLDPKAGAEQGDIRIVGEGLTEFAARHGNLTSVKARLEIKAIDDRTGEVVAIDRETSVHVDLTEQIAGKTALQEASATIAERLLPKIVQHFNKDDSKSDSTKK